MIAYLLLRIAARVNCIRFPPPGIGKAHGQFTG
jgi:hypothetical protein